MPPKVFDPHTYIVFRSLLFLICLTVTAYSRKSKWATGDEKFAKRQKAHFQYEKIVNFGSRRLMRCHFETNVSQSANLFPGIVVEPARWGAKDIDRHCEFGVMTRALYSLHFYRWVCWLIYHLLVSLFLGFRFLMN